MQSRKSRQGKRLMKTSKFEHCNITRQVLGPPTERQKQLADRAIRFGHMSILLIDHELLYQINEVRGASRIA